MNVTVNDSVLTDYGRNSLERAGFRIQGGELQRHTDVVSTLRERVQSLVGDFYPYYDSPQTPAEYSAARVLGYFDASQRAILQEDGLIVEQAWRCDYIGLDPGCSPVHGVCIVREAGSPSLPAEEPYTKCLVGGIVSVWGDDFYP